MRKEEEQLEHSLSALSRMAKFYRTAPAIANLAKRDLVSNRRASDSVCPEDENAVLAKLGDDLR
jgi:hypothetical protein